MPEVVFPEAVTAQGKKKVVILTSEPANPAAIPAATLATAVTAGLEATMYFLGTFAPGGSQNKGNGPRRVGERNQLQRLGTATYEAPTLAYVHDPQGSDTDVANKVKAALAPGAEVWIVERAGIDVNTSFAATQKYRVHHLELGTQFFAPSGDGEFDIEQVTQETGYLTPPIPGAVAA
jgi:hypothetical protein